MRLRRATLTAALSAVALTVGTGATAPAQTSLSAQAQSLRSQVAAESRRIASTTAGLRQAQARLDALDARVRTRVTQLRQAQDDLVAARVRLTKLQKRSEVATGVLSDNLRDSYKAGKPDVVTVVLDAKGFPDLLNRLSYFRRIAKRNARIVDVVRTARRDVAREAADLKRKRARLSVLARTAVDERREAAVVRNAIYTRQQAQIRARNGTSAQLAAVSAKIRRVERAAAVAARQQAAAATATRDAPSAPSPSPGSAPSDAGGAVAKVIAAANEIATTPYVYGGGHGGASGGYDCSGSISYALAAAGLVSGPLTSGAFMSWGEPGPGKHITVYANAGHAYMYVDGRRYDTSALSGGGTRWTTEPRSNAGFVARHPPGL